MNQFTAQQKIELLDRKYEFLMETALNSFIFDLEQFVDFIKEDEVIKESANKFLFRFEEKLTFYKEKFVENIQWIDSKAKEISIELRERTFNVGNLISDMVQNFSANRIFSAKRFDDETEIIQWLVDFRQDVYKFRENNPNKFSEEFYKEFNMEIEDKIEEHNYTWQLWKRICMTSAGLALKDLERIIERVFPKPFLNRESRALVSSEGNNGEIPYSVFAYGLERIPEMMSDYDSLQNFFYTNSQSESLITLTKTKITRVYEAIRQEIGSIRLRLTVLDRYKVRSQSYNKDYLRNLSNGIKRKSEELLSKDLALYLFDQGFPVWYRVKRGQHEYDFIHPDAKNPLLIEVKVCKKSDRRYILQGLKQIHAYLSSCESEFQISEGYYVVFRLGGTIYELPPKFSTNRFTIYPIIIDLGESLDSGSKQVAPTQISLEEIEKELGQN